MESGVNIKADETAATAAAERRPDIHELFCHYNSLYFDDAISACIVYWSDSPTARSDGMCIFPEGGGCEIRLSEPLLNPRSTADVKNTLLHEMIHAFLYFTKNLKDHSYHGPGFSAKMNEINSNVKTDPQRPAGGYNITFSHDLRKSVDDSENQYWTCTTCGDMIVASREPSANDCVENMLNYNCGSKSCHWHKHRTLCSGVYTKTTGKPERRGKTRALKAVQDYDVANTKQSSRRASQTKRSSVNVKEMEDSPKAKKPDTSHVVCRISKTQSPVCNNEDFIKKETKPTPLTAEANLSLNLKIPKRPRTMIAPKPSYSMEETSLELMELQESVCLKNRTVLKPQKQPSLSSQYFAVYKDDEKFNKEIKPLANKRTERRKKEKLEKMKDRLPVAVAHPSQVERSKTCIMYAGKRPVPPPEDNVVYISDDD